MEDGTPEVSWSLWKDMKDGVPNCNENSNDCFHSNKEKEEENSKDFIFN